MHVLYPKYVLACGGAAGIDSGWLTHDEYRLRRQRSARRFRINTRHHGQFGSDVDIGKAPQSLAAMPIWLALERQMDHPRARTRAYAGHASFIRGPGWIGRKERPKHRLRVQVRNYGTASPYARAICKADAAGADHRKACVTVYMLCDTDRSSNTVDATTSLQPRSIPTRSFLSTRSLCRASIQAG